MIRKGSMVILQNHCRCPPIGCSKNLNDLKDLSVQGGLM